MASDAELIKEVARRGEEMERDEERVEHESGIYNLSSETRELRNAGRKLVSDEDDAVNEDRQLIGAVKELQESVIAQRADITRAVKKMNQMLYEMRNMVERVESIYTEAKDDEHAMQQAALNGVNKAQLKAEEITLRRTLRNARTDIVRKQMRDAKRETLFSDMREEELNRLTSPYSVIREEMLFEVLDSEVLVLDASLGGAISSLPETEQAIILLYYFAEWTDKRIAAELGCPRSTVQLKRTRALDMLRKYLEEEGVCCRDRDEL